MLHLTKKITALVLSLAASTACIQAHAGSYMYCTDKDGTYNGSLDQFVVKDIPKEYQNAMKFVSIGEGIANGVKANIWLTGWTNNVTMFDSHPLLWVGDGWRLSVKSQGDAEKFCEFLKSFCPAEMPYLEVSGGNLSRNWWAHIYMEWGGGEGESYVCPNYQFNKGTAD